MDAITFSYARSKLAEVMRQVNDDHAPVLVTTQRGKPVVMMSLDDYNALEETAYLLRDPKRARRLMDSVDRLRAGGGTVRELIDADQV
jgi:antitoxin YefM